MAVNGVLNKGEKSISSVLLKFNCTNGMKNGYSNNIKNQNLKVCHFSLIDQYRMWCDFVGPSFAANVKFSVLNPTALEKYILHPQNSLSYGSNHPITFILTVLRIVIAL